MANPYDLKIGPLDPSKESELKAPPNSPKKGRLSHGARVVIPQAEISSSAPIGGSSFIPMAEAPSSLPARALSVGAEKKPAFHQREGIKRRIPTTFIGESLEAEIKSQNPTQHGDDPRRSLVEKELLQTEKGAKTEKEILVKKIDTEDMKKSRDTSTQ